MPDVWDLLRKKEVQLEKVRKEVEALRMLITLLADDPLPATVSPAEEIVWKDATTGLPVKAWP